MQQPSQSKSLKCSTAYNLKNDRMTSVRFQGKPYNITVIQAYDPTTNTKEAKAEQFYDDLQDLLELTPKKDVLFIVVDWNAKVGSQEIPGVTGKFGFGVQDKAGQKQTVLPKECTDHSKHPSPATLETTLHMDITRRPIPKIRLIIFFAAEDGEAPYNQQKQDQRWLWLRSWSPYCKIQT